jgi:hypothetical protein
VRARRNINMNTPFPREVPHGLNPPSGVIVDYSLAQAPVGEVALDVLDPSGTLIRHLSNAGETPIAEAARPTLPNFWEASPPKLTKTAGGNRADWDLRYTPPKVFAHTFETDANPGLTPPSPARTARASGHVHASLDCGRSHTNAVGDGDAGPALGGDRGGSQSPARARDEAREWSRAIARRVRPSDGAQGRGTSRGAAERIGEVTTALAALDSVIDSVAGDTAVASQFQLAGGPAPASKFVDVNAALVMQLKTQDYADQAPTPAMLRAWTKSCEALTTAMRLATARHQASRGAYRGVAAKPDRGGGAVR